MAPKKFLALISATVLASSTSGAFLSASPCVWYVSGHGFFASVCGSVLTTCLAGRGHARCADRWAGFITASVGNSVKAVDAVFRLGSVPGTFATITSASLSDSVSQNA